LPGGLHRLLSRNEKTTGALVEPARGFSSSIDSCSSTDLTPARQAKKAAEPKEKTCKQPTLRFHYDATLMIFLWSFLVTKSTSESKEKNPRPIFS
jgi:hypothetical protein